MKTFYKLTLIIIILVFAKLNFADGMFVPPEPLDSEIYEPNQIAIINYSNQNEDLYLLVKANWDNIPKFAWIIPVPSQPTVEEAPKAIFSELAILTNANYETKQDNNGCIAIPLAGSSDDKEINIIEVGSAGILEYAILEVYDASVMISWLNNNGYNTGSQYQSVIDNYISIGWYYFIAAQIDVSQINTLEENYNNYNDYYYDTYTSLIQPIKISFTAQQAVFPLFISSKNMGEGSDVIVYSIAEHRMINDQLDVEYARRIDQQDLDALKEDFPTMYDLFSNQDFFLTKSSNYFTNSQMQDLYFNEDLSDKESYPVDRGAIQPLFIVILFLMAFLLKGRKP